MRPWQSDFVGRYEHVTIESAALKDNPLGDEWRRPLWVYLPPAYDADADRRFPVIYLIQGYTGTLGMWGNRSPFRPTVLELIDDLFGRDLPGTGQWTIGEMPVTPSLEAPLLNLTAEHDRIAPASTAPEGMTAGIPSGHVGMIVGSARIRLHEALAQFLDPACR